jgi:hypothetical protein
MRSLVESFGFQSTEAGNWDAAVIDGSYFREAHPGFVNSREDGKARGCVWAGAWGNEKFRAMNFQAKEELLKEAAKRGVDIIIPATCIDASKCTRNMKMLEALGYKNHAIVVAASNDELIRRGTARAESSGKVFMPDIRSGFERVPEMLRELDGTYAIVTTMGRHPRVVLSGHGDADKSLGTRPEKDHINKAMTALERILWPRPWWKRWFSFRD